MAISEVLKQIALNPQAKNITLLVDITNTESEEEVSLLFSGITMNLMLEEEIELPETTQINFVRFTPAQWQSIASIIKAKGFVAQIRLNILSKPYEVSNSQLVKLY